MVESGKTYRCLYLAPLCFSLLVSCAERKDNLLEPGRLETGNVLIIEKGNLKGVFVDNTAMAPDHRPGYSGIAQLYHTALDSGIFVAEYAGFNLEHIFGGDSLEQLFEPRRHPMTLYRKTDEEVLLYQTPTPLSSVESLTSFKVKAPHYIDVTFQCVFHDTSFFKHGYAGLFWASYIHVPEDKKIYFRGTTEGSDSVAWIAAQSDQHGVASTHKGADERDDFFFSENFNARLASHFSNYRFTEPFFFGRYKNMVIAYFLDAGDNAIRISQSPTGGGGENPAWDFQYLVTNPEQGKKYSYRARLMYKPFVSEQDVIEEFQNWKK